MCVLLSLSRTRSPSYRQFIKQLVPVCAPMACAEHQPPSWSSYFTDLHLTSLLAPAGLLLCFRPLTDASLFLLLYGVTAVYFSGVMVSFWPTCVTRGTLLGCWRAHAAEARKQVTLAS